MATATTITTTIDPHPSRLYNVKFGHETIKVLVTCHSNHVENWVSEVKRNYRSRCVDHSPIVGVDVEFSPNQAATLHLCVGHRCLLFQISRAESIPESLKDFLKEEYAFVGIEIDEKLNRLACRYDITMNRTVDLGELAANWCESDEFRTAGLFAITRTVLGHTVTVPRSLAFGRWDDVILSAGQVLCASIAVFLCFEIGKIMNASG